MPGPKPIVSKQEIESLLNKGYLKKEIASKLGVSFATIKRHSQGLRSLKQANAECVCKTCGATGEENFYKTARYQCKSCWNKRTYQSAKDTMALYMDSRGGAKCQRCGYDKCSAALEFHHRDPAEKDPSWSRGWSLPRLKKELDKCDILCANCHREVHWLT